MDMHRQRAVNVVKRNFYFALMWFIKPVRQNVDSRLRLHSRRSSAITLSTKRRKNTRKGCSFFWSR